jgi:HlyD family secretion protein
MPPENGPIGCVGRIEPGEGIVRIAAPGMSGPAIVSRLLVREGDAAQAGQVLAELDTKGRLEAAQHQADARIEVARKRLAQVQSGAKPSEIATQQSDISRVEIELANAEREFKRHVLLGDMVTASQLDGVRMRVDTLAQALNGARQRLVSLTEIRPVDVDVASAELAEAVRSQVRARAELETSTIRSPIDGRVIKIYARPGEQVLSEGVMELAPIDPMYAVAEVAESDMPRVRVGRRAKVSGDGLPNPVHGTVERVSLKVLQNQLMPVDPARFSDARVVNVWIRLDDSRRVADLIHMRVDVVIQP